MFSFHFSFAQHKFLKYVLILVHRKKRNIPELLDAWDIYSFKNFLSTESVTTEEFNLVALGNILSLYFNFFSVFCILNGIFFYMVRKD